MREFEDISKIPRCRTIEQRENLASGWSRNQAAPIDHRLPDRSNLSRENQIVPAVHEQCSVDVGQDLLGSSLGNDRLVDACSFWRFDMSNRRPADDQLSLSGSTTVAKASVNGNRGSELGTRTGGP